MLSMDSMPEQKQRTQDTYTGVTTGHNLIPARKFQDGDLDANDWS